MLAKTKQMLFAILALALGLIGASAHAADPTPIDYSLLTNQITFASVSLALLGVAGSIAGVYILWKGAKMILGAIRGA